MPAFARISIHPTAITTVLTKRPNDIAMIKLFFDRNNPSLQLGEPLLHDLTVTHGHATFLQLTNPTRQVKQLFLCCHLTLMHLLSSRERREHISLSLCQQATFQGRLAILSIDSSFQERKTQALSLPYEVVSFCVEETIRVFHPGSLRHRHVAAEHLEIRD